MPEQSDKRRANPLVGRKVDWRRLPLLTSKPRPCRVCDPPCCMSACRLDLRVVTRERQLEQRDDQGRILSLGLIHRQGPRGNEPHFFIVALQASLNLRPRDRWI